MQWGWLSPLTEMSTRNISWGVKAAGALGWPYHLLVPIVLKSGSLILLEPSGPVQACNGSALPLLAIKWQRNSGHRPAADLFSAPYRKKRQIQKREEVNKFGSKKAQWCQIVLQSTCHDDSKWFCSVRQIKEHPQKHKVENPVTSPVGNWTTCCMWNCASC